MRAFTPSFIFFHSLAYLNLLTANNYPYRELSTPIFRLPQNVQIIQYSPARTGSTLIYNILTYLFEDIDTYHLNPDKRVVKIHSFNRDITQKANEFHYYFVGTIRDPFQTVLSRLKVIKNEITLDLIDNITNEVIDDYNLYFKNVLNITALNDNFLIFRYENSHTNFSFIYSQIENFFHIKISQEQKNLITKYFNEKSMYNLSLRYKDFDEFDPITGVHGNHITHTQKNNIIPIAYAPLVYHKLQPTMTLWDYPIDAQP